MQCFIHTGKVAYNNKKILDLEANEVIDGYKKFKEVYSKAEVFVFERNSLETSDLKQGNIPKLIDANEVKSFPFSVISFEIANRHSIISSPDKKAFCYNIIAVEKEEFGEYEFYAMHEFDENIQEVFFIDSNSHSLKYREMCGLTDCFLRLIFKEKYGVEKTKTIVRLNRKDKEKRKINRVIYVSSKKYQNEVEPKNNIGKINWSHSFLVCGHWRRLTNPESIGLDRLGKRTVKGKTFIKPFTKGEGDLIRKVRIKK